MVVPAGVADIGREGRLLGHCVAANERYYDRIASGESYILFLRRATEPEKPWYTMEVEPGGRIRQLRTMGDGEGDKTERDEAKAFLRAWSRAVRARCSEAELKAAEESEEAAQRADELAKELERANAETDKAKKKADDAAKKGEADMEKLKAEVAAAGDREAALRREYEAKLRAVNVQSDARSAKVKLYLGEVQRYIGAMDAELDAMEADAAGSGAKLRAQVAVALDKLIAAKGLGV